MIRNGRIFFVVHLVALIFAGETIHTLRKRDAESDEVSRETKANIYTGNYGYLVIPTLVMMAVATSTILYVVIGRLMKKILYAPSKNTIVLVTHNLFGGERVLLSRPGCVATNGTSVKVEGHKWSFWLFEDAEIPNRGVFNSVMGASDFTP